MSCFREQEEDKMVRILSDSIDSKLPLQAEPGSGILSIEVSVGSTQSLLS